MKLTQSVTTIDTAAPAAFTCAQCPFARHIDGNRYCCQVSQTASDVKRGHWEATISCFEALVAAEAEKEAALAAKVEETAAPIAQTAAPAVSRAPSTPAAASHTVTTTAPARALIAPAAIETDNQPPGRGDGGRG
ncbi:hypothetical protein [Microcoleus sp. D3_18a_C4]|uniref:hypothetical protein n=1 Tax=Microcoleus sp. D3_18a_C4 TaxID=3055332 RepID=UPI002FD5FF5D